MYLKLQVNTSLLIMKGDKLTIDIFCDLHVSEDISMTSLYYNKMTVY